MLLLVIKWILLFVRVSECVIDTCREKDITTSKKVANMCQSTTVMENYENTNANFDSVFLSLTEQADNCSCTVSVKTTKNSVNLYIKRLNNLTQQLLCGMEVDIYQQRQKNVVVLDPIPTRCNSTNNTIFFSNFKNENLQLISKVVDGNFLIGYCIHIGIVHGNEEDDSYLEISCENHATTTPINTPTQQQTAVNDVRTSTQVTTPIDTQNHIKTTINDVMTSTSSQIISTLSTSTFRSDNSQIHDKTDSEGDTTLFIAVGAGGGFVLLVSVLVVILLCKRRKSHHSGKEENNANHTANSTADDDNDDGLKYNAMYVSSERHDDIDVNYSTVDGDIPRHISGDDEGGYSTVDDNKNIQDTSLNTRQFPNIGLEVKDDDDVEHINAPTESGCVYAVVDKSHKINSSVKNIKRASTSAVYAVVDKSRVRHFDEGNK